MDYTVFSIKYLRKYTLYFFPFRKGPKGEKKTKLLKMNSKEFSKQIISPPQQAPGLDGSDITVLIWGILLKCYRCDSARCKVWDLEDFAALSGRKTLLQATHEDFAMWVVLQKMLFT